MPEHWPMVIVKLPGKEAEVTHLLRCQPEGVEVSGPEWLAADTGVRVYEWSRELEKDFRKFKGNESMQLQVLDAETRGHTLFPMPPPPRPPKQPMTNAQVAAKLLEYPDYMTMVYDADNGWGEDANVLEVIHDHEKKQTTFSYLDI